MSLGSWVHPGCFLDASGCLLGTSWMRIGCLLQCLLVQLLNKTACLLGEQEDISSCWARRHVCLWSKRTCLHVEPEDAASHCIQKHVFPFNKKARLFAAPEDMSSCLARHVVLLNKLTCLLVEQVDMSPCWREGMSSCPYGHGMGSSKTVWGLAWGRFVIVRKQCF